MDDYLRNISLKVEELEPGVFGWVLLESPEDDAVVEELEASADSFDSWSDALDAGVVALKSLAEDLAVGPRTEVEDEDADPVG